jgi:hypothetical protein
MPLRDDVSLVVCHIGLSELGGLCVRAALTTWFMHSEKWPTDVESSSTEQLSTAGINRCGRVVLSFGEWAITGRRREQTFVDRLTPNEFYESIHILHFGRYLAVWQIMSRSRCLSNERDTSNITPMCLSSQFALQWGNIHGNDQRCEVNDTNLIEKRASQGVGKARCLVPM